MGKRLIITEKPSVARDFARVFQVNGRGNGSIENQEYVITWCVGHLVEMLYPEDYDLKYKKWRIEDLPFLPKEYRYGVIVQVKSQYEIVNTLLHREDIDVVYWAGDSGKEGQTIEENIRHFGGVRQGMKELRVWIDSQTDEEIKRGIAEAKPMSDYANLGKSGIMRSIEDYALGINFSRALSVKYGKLLNDAAATKSYTAIAVGRVMTCVLGMVVIREREIRNFVETPFYRVIGNFYQDQIHAEWRVTNQSKYFESPLLYKENGFKKEESAQTLISELTGKKAVIASVDKNITKKKAPLLFNLTELQAECSKLFKIAPDQTLQIAQDLYERKLTTYPRTDARVLTTAVAKEIQKNLFPLKNYTKTQKFVGEILNQKLYLHLEKTQYTDDSKVTDHYAIIPTGQLKELQGLSELHGKVYELILRRFLSIFYPPAEYMAVKISISIENEMLYASSKTLVKPGYMEISGLPKNIESDNADDGDDSEKQNLSALADQLKKGDEIDVNSFGIKEGKTAPPKRYTTGTMVLAMENAGNLIEDEELRAQIKNTGIGTSATRAEIIKKLIHIGYLNLNVKTQILTPERLGEMIYEVVNLTTPSLLNPQMTASWEKGLDGITKGTVVVEEYREKLEAYVRNETLSMIQGDLTHEIAERINPFTGKDAKGIAAKKNLHIPCPLCKGDITTTPFGYGCANYRNEDIHCNFSVGSVAGVDLSEEDFIELMTKGRTKVIDGFVSKSKKKFKAALVFQMTEENKPEIQFDFSQNGPDIVDGIKCPNCGGDILVKSFGFGCANYHPEEKDSCKFAIGKIAGKDLSEAQVKDLLQNGRTKTIRGFKSKKGSKFDACLMLVPDENGKSTVKFDFSEVESKVIKDVKCPICGGEIVKTAFGYGCKNFDKSNPESCKFSIGRIAGVDLKEAQVKKLLNEGKTDVIEGFIAKTGMKFDVACKLTDDYRVAFDFPEKVEPTETEISCPNCGKKLKIGPWNYTCDCGFSMQHTIAKVKLEEDVVKELLTTGRTKNKMTGFTSKTGNPFDAFLHYKDGKVTFDFGQTDEKPYITEAPQV